MKRFKTIISAAALALGFTHTASAGPAVLRLGYDADLSDNYIMGIAQDRDGYVWLSTENGLNRFDGNSFTTVNPGAPYVADGLNRIVADTVNDILWVCHQRSGLDAIDCRDLSVTGYRKGDGPGDLTGNGVTDVSVGPDGKVWASIYDRGLDMIDTSTRRVTHYNTATVRNWPDDPVWTVVAADNGLVYLGHKSAGFTVFNPATATVTNYRHDPAQSRTLPGNEVRAICVDRRGFVWVGTDGGLALYNPQSDDFSTFSYIPGRHDSLLSDMVYHIAQTADGRLWVSTENGGVSILDITGQSVPDPATASFTNLTSVPSDGVYLSNKTIHAVFEDSFGNIWIGTYGDGADVICHRDMPVERWHTGSLISPLSDNSVMSVCVAGDTIFAGTDGAGVDMFVGNRRAENINAANSALTDNAVLALMRSADGSVWMGTYRGDVAVRRPDGRVTHIDIGSRSDVRCFATAPDGTVIAGTGSGIVGISPDGSSVTPLTRSSQGSEWIRSLMVDCRGRVWEGSFGRGITVYDTDFKPVHYIGPASGLLSGTVNMLVNGPDGNVIAATDNGMAIIGTDGNVKRIVTTGDGLADNRIKALSFDRTGRLWMSTGAGVSLMDRDGRISNYAGGHGITGRDFYGASAAVTAGGSIVFGSHNGLYIIDPNQAGDAMTLPDPVITGVRIYGKGGDSSDSLNLSPGKAITLSHDQNSVNISFGIRDAAVASLVEWSYSLGGDGSRWYPANHEGGIQLRDLVPGHYELKLRASAPGVAEPSYTTFSITVEPPFWTRWWAKCIYVLLAAAAIAAGLRFWHKRLQLEYALDAERRRSQQEGDLNAERMRFFTNITHELRSPLTLILGPLEDMNGDRTLSTAQAEKISMIHKSASRLLELINTILEFRKTETQNRQLRVEHSDMAMIVAEIGRHYRGLSTNRALEVVTDIAPGDYSLWFDVDVVRMIIDNLMSNACKYTPAGRVTLSLAHTEESGVPFTQISVSDTGQGIDPDTLPHIFDRYYRGTGAGTRLGTGIGLALVYNLVQLHQGEIFVDSDPGRGTTFRFRIHTDNTYPDAIRTSPRDTSGRSAAPSAEPGQEKTLVLVVDDNVDILGYITSVLSDSYIVETACDGAEGLDKAHRFMPDIIITDVMMPRLDGMDMVRRLKSDPATSHIPVVVVTAKIAEEARLEAYDCGADSFISKPFSSKLLLTRIKNILSTRHSLARRFLDNGSARPVEPGGADTAGTAADSPIVSKMSEADREFLSKVAEVINANIDSESLDVDFIADKMNMSHSTLYRKVKAVTGMSVARLLRRYRARRAAELLETGKYTISEIAMMVGMGSMANFRQCFRDEYGTAPSEYMRSRRE